MQHDAADPLRLIAFDAEDLAVISAHLQDALLKRADIAWMKDRGRFALVMRRFDWEGAGSAPRRRLTGLHFDRVESAQSLAVEPDADKVLSLLAITFVAEGEGPSGHVVLHFAGGATLRLGVECLEVQMKDLGPVWEAVSVPSHPDEP